jgi:competence protein ComEC
MLIDAGPSEAGDRVVEVLKASGVSRLDWIMGSHPHADHIGGLVDVLRGVPVTQALDPGYNHGTVLQKTYLSLLKEKGVKAVRARKGQTYPLGKEVRVEILAPEEPLLKGTDSDPNNNSIVARVVYGSTRFLFTGDMEEPERERLLHSAAPDALRADVLKVAHHGSHNGTDAVWLNAVRPKYGVISLAAGNEYGHPHRPTLTALRDAQVEVLRTDERGDIVFSSDGKQLTLEPASESSSPRTPPGPGAGGNRANNSPTSSYQGKVIGNSASMVYHAPTCDRLPSAGRRVELASVAAAEKAGYHPHRSCLPAK